MMILLKILGRKDYHLQVMNKGRKLNLVVHREVFNAQKNKPKKKSVEWVIRKNVNVERVNKKWFQ